MIFASFLDDLGIGVLLFLGIIFAGLHSMKKSLRNVPWEGVARTGLTLTRVLMSRR